VMRNGFPTGCYDEENKRASKTHSRRRVVPEH
jgi:hypothetical protein